MDTEQLKFFSALQRIADALEENNKTNKAVLELSRAIHDTNKDWIAYNIKVREDDITMQEQQQALEAKQNNDS